MTYQKMSTSRHFASIVPLAFRLIIGGTLAFTISHTVTLRLFNETIQERLYTLLRMEKARIGKGYESAIKEIEDKIAKLNNEIADNRKSVGQVSSDYHRSEVQRLDKAIADKQSEIADELAGISKRTGRPTEGPVAKELKNDLNYLKLRRAEAANSYNNEQKAALQRSDLEQKRLSDQIERNMATIATLRGKISLIEDKEAEDLKKFEDHAANDFVARTKALYELGRTDSTVYIWTAVFMGLFMGIDVVALVLKIISQRDDYDSKVETQQLWMEAVEYVDRSVIDTMKGERIAHAIKEALCALSQAESNLKLNNSLIRHRQLGMYYAERVTYDIKQDIEFVTEVSKHRESIKNSVDEKYGSLLISSIDRRVEQYFAESEERDEEFLKKHFERADEKMQSEMHANANAA